MKRSFDNTRSTKCEGTIDHKILTDIFSSVILNISMNYYEDNVRVEATETYYSITLHINCH